MAKTPQVKSYHLKARCGGQVRNLGTVFIAGYDAPPCIRGQRILYRNTIDSDRDLYMFKDKTTGFSKAGFDFVVNDGVQFIVAQSKESGRMIVISVRYFTFSRNDGQGLQSRAYLNNAIFDGACPRLSFPTAVGVEYVSDEEPSIEPFDVRPVQPELPAIQQKGIYRKCGCLFVGGAIKTPCLTHKDVWSSALSAALNR